MLAGDEAHSRRAEVLRCSGWRFDQVPPDEHSRCAFDAAAKPGPILRVHLLPQHMKQADSGNFPSSPPPHAARPSRSASYIICGVLYDADPSTRYLGAVRWGKDLLKWRHTHPNRPNIPQTHSWFLAPSASRLRGWCGQRSWRRPLPWYMHEHHPSTTSSYLIASDHHQRRHRRRRLPSP